jgi:RNA-binding protein
LTGKQKRFLRGLGHALDPIVHVGKAGITEGLVRAVDRALVDHELIKLRVLEEAPVDRKHVADELATQACAAVVQILGRNVLLYRPRPEEPGIVLPAGPVGP